LQRLSFIIVLICCPFILLGQSPHGNNLKIDCAQCHNPSGWQIDYETIQFDHNTTNFELEGTHAIVDCKSCHADLVFENAPTDCISCHLDVHSASVGNDCMRCHNSESWLVFEIPELHEQNGFPLIGAHSNLSCVECHQMESSLIFNRLGNECIECHRDDYVMAQNPNHVVSGFSQDCIECHSPLGFGWDAGGIIHDFFPLTLGHDIQDCSACHNVNNFSDISADCIACHMEDYASAQNPNHQSGNFPTDCTQCHTINPGWMPATINHDFFPLTLGHNIQDCNACHTNGNFNNTPTDCFACHMDDYVSTNNPNHQAANFPTDCAQCHTTNPGWMPATFDHDSMFFPIYSGKHEDVWNSCTDCHMNPNNFAIFQCLTCHPSGEMADEHEGVNGYVYESNACLACHPDGEE
jgi:hypothetical protein